MKLPRKFIPFFIFILAFSFLFLSFTPTVNAAPVTVSTTSFAAPVWIGWQHKLFYAQSRYWIFRCDGTNLVYDSSTDGNTWSANTSIVATDDSGRVSVYTNSTHVVYVRWDPAVLTTYFRQGSLGSDGVITWNAAEQTIVTDAAYNYGAVNIAIDNQGLTWVCGTWYSGVTFQVRVYKNSKTDGTWTAAVGFPINLLTTVGTIVGNVIVPLTSSGQVTVVFLGKTGGSDSYALTARRWTGATWTDAINYTTNNVTVTIGYGQFDAVAQNDTVHVAFSKGGVNKLYYIQFAGDAWSGYTSISDVGAFTSSCPNLAFDYVNSTLYAFYHSKSTSGNITADHMYYRARVSSVWSDQVDWIDESADDFTTNGARANSFWVQGQNSTQYWIAVAYGTKAASPYNVRFAQLFGTIPNPSPTIGAPTTSWDDADNCYAQKKAYTVQVTYSDTYYSGFLDINYCELFLKTGANATRGEFAFCEDTATFSTVSGSTEWDMSGSNVSSGNDITVTWSINAQWDATEEADLDLLCFVNDSAYQSTNAFTNENFDVVTRLVTSGLNANDSRTNINGPVTISGTVYYGNDPGSNVASTSYPPNVEFNSVSIHSATHAVAGTDATIVNGAFSVDFTIPNTVQTNTYHVFINMLDADYTDADAVDGDTVSVVGDALTAFNIQTVQFRGSGAYYYQAQIEWAFDSVVIENATVGVSYPNGSSITTVNSNSSGWVTFTISQSNATNGDFQVYGASDNGTYVITAIGSNATFTLSQWVLNVTDIEGNALSTETVTVTNSSISVWSGSDSFFAPNTTYTVNVTWLQNLEINYTTINLSGDTTTLFNCSGVYPFTVSGTRYWVASNATIATKTYASSLLVLTFSGGASPYTLVSSCPTQPSFILNVTYDLVTDFTPYGYLVLPHYGNITLSLSYESWSNTYIESTDQIIISSNLTGYKLYVVTNGVTGVAGVLKVYCGSRGNPATTTGFVTTSYMGSTLTGNYVFASDVTGVLDWTSYGTPGTSSTSTSTPSGLVASIAFGFPSMTSQGVELNGKLNITWTGLATIYLWDVRCDSPYSDWKIGMPSGLPFTLNMVNSLGQVSLDIVLFIPKNATIGSLLVPCTVILSTSQGSTKTMRSVVSLDLTTPTVNIPNTLTFLFLIPLALVVFFAIFRRRSKREG